MVMLWECGCSLKVIKSQFFFVNYNNEASTPLTSGQT
jgi:hypothetical protein